jgi:hypothetical protein
VALGLGVTKTPYDPRSAEISALAEEIRGALLGFEPRLERQESSADPMGYRFLPARNRKFESISLQRRVYCEPGRPGSDRISGCDEHRAASVGTIDDVVAVVAVMWARRRGGNARYRSHASAYSRADTRTPTTPCDRTNHSPVPAPIRPCCAAPERYLLGMDAERSRRRLNACFRIGGGPALVLTAAATIGHALTN